MIAVDTSALMAIILDEPEAGSCIKALADAPRLLISAATAAEALIVASRRDAGDKMARLIEGLGVEVVSVTLASAKGAARAYAKWGKGIHPAGLNFGDCFAYEVADTNGCPLLFTGKDFARTDIACAL